MAQVDSALKRTLFVRPMKTLAEEMATWIAALRYESLPPEIVQKTKLVLLDAAGCALGALNAPPVRLARRVAKRQGGNPLATPIGAGWKTATEHAAFINALAIRYLDFNDYTDVGNHPSTNIGAALAVAEACGRGGKELLLAIVIAYEVQMRMRDACVEQRDGWDNSTLEHYSMAALAGKLLGLSPERLAHALAIAGAHANTLAEVRRGRLSMWKAAAEAMSAKMGTYAALLAEAGVTGPLGVIDSDYGFAKQVARRFSPAPLRRRDGKYHIARSCMKMWPCLFVAQAPIAAALELYGRGVRAPEIAAVRIALSDFAYKQQKRFQKTGVATREDADHSVPYCVARVFLDGRVWLPEFEEHKLAEPAVVSLMKKISFRRDLKLPERMGAVVEVELRDGRRLRARMPYGPGHTKNPVGETEVARKFYALAGEVLGEEKARRAAELILHAEELPGVSPLMAALAAPPKVQ
ncbi:MAG TPA: MmgE/PrpD family protein [Candidatus Acidoferrales bacterium]|nr:MmgE/PrpD family protein [Candidatus Acidoferrales bacterium]